MMKAVISSERFNFAALECRRFFSAIMPRMFFGTAVFHLAHFCQHLFRTLLMSAWAQTWAWSSSWWAKWVFRPSLLPPKKWELEKALFFHKPTCNFPGLKNLKNEGKNHFFWPRHPKFSRGHGLKILIFFYRFWKCWTEAVFASQLGN